MKVKPPQGQVKVYATDTLVWQSLRLPTMHSHVDSITEGSPNDAVEAHSCVDPLMPNSFLSKTQLLMINQLQDVSTRRSLSTAYRIITSSSHHILYTVDKVNHRS